ncbi:BrnT family toxin [Endozoicomonas sp. Mp262]|uniref:BrnT family toxin n=1 Tax=Endozoicomonas sp. Mp262 TaxID=2919499 RepID=UPI0021DA77DC
MNRSFSNYSLYVRFCLYHLSLALHTRAFDSTGNINGVVVLVAHTFFEGDREEVIRIISARKATLHERRVYEKKRLNS